MRYIAFLLALALSFSACKNKEQGSEEARDTGETTEQSSCIWAYDDAASAEVHWTVYKTTARVPVNGQFKEVKIVTGPPKKSLVEYLKSVKFDIPVAGTITGDAARDAKIIKFFFEAMSETDRIIGSAQKIEGDDNSGKITFTVTMNGLTKEVSMPYNFDNGKLMMKGSLNLDDWSTQAAMKTLNEACKEKHTGEDGKTYVAPDVDLQIMATLTCKR